MNEISAPNEPQWSAKALAQAYLGDRFDAPRVGAHRIIRELLRDLDERLTGDMERAADKPHAERDEARAGLAPQPQLGHVSTLGYVVVQPEGDSLLVGAEKGDSEDYPNDYLYSTQQDAAADAGPQWEVCAVIPVRLLDGAS